jgi:hypothetical protein
VNVKGSVLRARLRYVEERGGDNGYRHFFDALQPTTRAAIEARVLASGWYPFAAFIDICEVIDRQLGAGDLALCHELGRHGCDANLPTLYKIFFRMADVLYIVRRAAAAWRVNYDEGSMSVVGEGDHVVTLRMEVPAPHRAHCLSVRGWIVRAGELSGAKDVRVAESCRVLGDPHCQFELRWRDK